MTMNSPVVSKPQDEDVSSGRALATKPEKRAPEPSLAHDRDRHNREHEGKPGLQNQQPPGVVLLYSNDHPIHEEAADRKAAKDAENAEPINPGLQLSCPFLEKVLLESTSVRTIIAKRG